MPTLRTLEARFMRHSIQPADEGHGRKRPDGTTQWGGFDVDTYSPVESIADADLVKFLCPKCFAANGGKKGTHQVYAEFAGRNCPPEMNNGVRWQFSGTSIDDLTITPSILCIGGCAWHGFVENGQTRDA